MNRKSKILTASAGLFAAAFTGMISGCHSQSASTDAGSSMNASDLDKHACKGMNACKGHGGCKTSDAGCKGQNSCKGKGGCKSM